MSCMHFCMDSNTNNNKEINFVKDEDIEQTLKKLNIKPGFIKGTDIVKLFKNENDAIEEISTETFLKVLKEKNLGVANFKGFLRIIKR